MKGPRKRIMVVDGSPQVRTFTCKLLEDKGYYTQTAEGGHEAYRMLEHAREAFHLVVTELHLPDESGQALLHRIKTNDATRDIPVVFVTATADHQRMHEAFETGLAAWIFKPYRADVFFREIESVITGYNKGDSRVL